MIAFPFGVEQADEAVRVIRALGAHRYVAGRVHLVHAFAFAALEEACPSPLEAGLAWARQVLADARVDAASRDEALWRRCPDAELASVVESFWGRDAAARRAAARLRELLERHECHPGGHAPFDEAHEDEMHPLLVDAGWELLPLAHLDSERHKGAIAAFGEPLAFEVACFEEQSAIPPRPNLYELPALGAIELTAGVDDAGRLAAPLVVWAEGNETYLDYVFRGVRRAAKLPEPTDG